MEEFKKKLRSYFVTGAKPTEQQFAELIDRGVYLDKNGEVVVSKINHEASDNPIMGYLQASEFNPSSPVFAKIITDVFAGISTELRTPHGITNAFTEKRILLVYPYRELFTQNDFFGVSTNTISWDDNDIILKRANPGGGFGIPMRMLILFTYRME